MKKLQPSQSAIQFLAKKKSDKKFVTLLETSLKIAKKKAEKGLDTALYKELAWPLTFQEYLNYLSFFSKWKPQQSKLPAWDASGPNTSQEVYDRLTHFYFLIDQDVTEEDCSQVIVQNIPWFRKWLVDFANLWGSFLNTTDSFNQKTLASFRKESPEFQVENSMINGQPNIPSGWLTFNQFFARELNPGLRPIAYPMCNKVVTTPADCTFRKLYPINKDSEIPEITVKQTHKFANIKDLLKGSKYADAFANGTFVHYFLGPYSYHRFHVPVSGLVQESYAVQGLVHLDVNITNKQFNAPDSSQGGYEFTQARGIISIDTTNSPYGNMGIVTVIPIGMAQVSSVVMTATENSNLMKGDEFGYFLFGGSDIIMLFQEGMAPKIDECSHYRHYGMDISTCPPVIKK